jgi:two-component system NtrC family sensor kinase
MSVTENIRGEGVGDLFRPDDDLPALPPIRRGTQARIPLKVALIGGGQACADLLTLLVEERLGRLGLEILGVADPNPEAPGIRQARQLGIFTTSDFNQLYQLPGLNLIIELTGSTQVRERMIRTKPLEISSIDHRGARLLWDLIQIEAEKTQLQSAEIALEEEVRRHQEYLENILAHSSDMIITTGLDDRIVTFNPGGERMLGYSQAEIIGRSIAEIWENPKNRKQLMAEVRTRGAVNNFPAVLLTKSGQLVEISLSLSLLRDREGRILGTVGISKDVTEENRLRRQLIENERLAAIGQTVAGISHCMKNILNGLKGGSYLVNTGLKKDDRALLEEGWQIVQNSVERISKLSLDMLGYCRDRTPDLSLVDPLQLIRDTVNLVQQTARMEGIEIIIRGAEGFSFPLDASSLFRAMMNLIMNAIEACREKEYPPGESPRVEVFFEPAESDLVFQVRDNGIGMDEEIQRNLFKRFFTTKEFQGTGLGLPVTEKMVKEQGGRLTAESSPGQGSVFTIRLPLREKRQEPAHDR